MGILTPLRSAKTRAMARPNEPDMPPKRNEMVQLCIISSKRDLEYLRYSCQCLPHNANLIVCLGV